MTERTVANPPVAEAFPGATALTLLDVYDWPTPDGLRGGSAHMHLASTEGYVVLSGAGRLQTLGADGYTESALRPWDCLWFTPGTVHRLVNDGGLRLLVIMQNAGLPEAGDAVLTFPPDVLADRDAYARAATLSPPGQAAASPAGEAAARRRRDLAIEGYLVLRERVIAAGPAALDGFLAAAVALVSDRVPDWRDRWQAGALGAAKLTGQHLDGIAAGNPEHLRAAAVLAGKPTGTSTFGMCGRLTALASR